LVEATTCWPSVGDARVSEAGAGAPRMLATVLDVVFSTARLSAAFAAPIGAPSGAPL
jgi:hypothetical protein